MTTVLVVDDERDVRSLLADTLTDAGYGAIEAPNGRGALETVDRERPDVVLLDVMMPMMDGMEVLGKLRQNPETEKLPVILLTAYPALKGEQTRHGLGRFSLHHQTLVPRDDRGCGKGRVARGRHRELRRRQRNPQTTSRGS